MPRIRKERIEKLLESGWVNEFNYLESQLQEARCLVVILQQKVEQLENIRKKAIEFTNSHFKEMVADEEAQALLNILNKGSESNV